jgi:glycogen synthase
MRIAFISWELPPATGGGGIGTYLVHVVSMLVEGGHDIEVFAGAGGGGEGSRKEGEVLVHRFGATVGEFLDQVGGVVRDRHSLSAFDVAEAPEFFAQGAAVMQLAPDLPVVVKLHTPSCVVDRYNFNPLPFRSRLRWRIGALRRLKWPQPLPRLPEYSAADDPEAVTTRMADQISAPTEAIWNLLRKEWELPAEKRFDVPYPFRPDERMLALPISRSTSTLLFLGRLEGRKGVVELVHALRRVLRKCPKLRVRFVGRAHPSPSGSGDFADWVRRQLRSFSDRVELPGPIPSESLPEVFASSMAAIFPSRWENHPNVCLEAMSAGCPVIGSCHGGMPEILDGGRCGMLVDPFRESEVGNAIIRMFEDVALRQEYAAAARERLLTAYDSGRLISRYEAGYELAIANHERRLSQCRS